jgi:hypothetical protein
MFEVEGFNMLWVILFIVLLVGLDKGLTYANIKSVEKNFPGKDALSIEKNPLAKWFFQKCGVLGGTIVYFFISILTFLGAFYLLNLTLKNFVTNSPTISLYVLTIWYAFVIGNNFFFFLKFNRIIP